MVVSRDDDVEVWYLRADLSDRTSEPGISSQSSSKQEP